MEKARLVVRLPPPLGEPRHHREELRIVGAADVEPLALSELHRAGLPIDSPESAN
jgi:hypothetical protein